MDTKHSTGVPHILIGKSLSRYHRIRLLIILRPNPLTETHIHKRVPTQNYAQRKLIVTNKKTSTVLIMNSQLYGSLSNVNQAQ